MAIDRLSFALALAAAGLGGYALYAQSTAAHDARARAEADAALEARLLALETAAKSASEARPPTLAAAPGAAARARTGGTAAAGPGAAGDAAAPGATAPLTVEQRVAELERQLKAVAESSTAEPVQTVASEAPPDLEHTWFGDLDGAAKALDLTPPQRAEWERSIADAKRALEELRKVPDETGRTWEQAQKDGVTIVDGSISYDGTQLQAFREKVIPGRNESFGAADRRLRTEAKKRMREALGRDQQDRFDKAHVDGLLPGGGGDGGAFLSFFSGFGGAINVVTPEPAPAPEAGK